MKKLGIFKRRKFRRILKKSNKGLTILVRKDPTPDSLASAYALKKIAEFFHINTKCYYPGIVHHKTILNIMGTDIESLPGIITDELSRAVALIDVVPSELPEGLSSLIGIPSIIISHSKATTKDIKSHYKDIRGNVETTSTIMIQYMKGLKVPLDKSVGTLLLFAIRERTRTFLTNLNRNGLEAYLYALSYMDHDLLLKLENPSVKSETFNDLSLAITNRTIKDTFLLTNTGYVKDPSTLPKVCKYMLDLEGISTALVFAVNTSKIYIYVSSNNIEVNVKQILKKAFGHCGNIVGGPSFASIIIPLGVFNVITEGVSNTDSKTLLLRTIEESIYSSFLKTIEKGEQELENK